MEPLLGKVGTARLIGGAGTGKTHRLMLTLDKVLQHVPATQIGFVTFTRAARAEAVARASDRMGLPPAALEKRGWFRTLHSICYRLLGIERDQLLSDNASSRQWVSAALNEPVASLDGDLDEAGSQKEQKTDADKALGLWNTARNRLLPLRQVYTERQAFGDDLPVYDWVLRIIQKYEDAKAVEDRRDFADLLARVAGYRLWPEGLVRVDPEGEAPALAAWFHDEMQDSSRLADAVFRRLISAPTTRWVYLAGDPYQSIYLFSGADPACFMGLDVDKEEVMGQSHRCPAPILALGERILANCSDYFDRHIKPAPHEGEVLDRTLSQLEAEIDPRQPWLLLARTNYHLARLRCLLDKAAIPWAPTRGPGGWKPTVRTTAIKTLLAMQEGRAIPAGDWLSVVKTLPAKGRLAHGTKAFWTQTLAPEQIAAMPLVAPEEWDALGLEPGYAQKIRSGQWEEDVPGAAGYVGALRRWGQEVVDQPRVRLGTIHSAKGAEADNVAVLRSSNYVIQRAMSIQREYDAEMRVWYVAVTRARQRLVILDDPDAPFKKAIPTCDLKTA